eukprot:gene9060-biopygen4069
MAPTASPSTSPALAVNTATQDALRSLVTNGTASSGTVTSVTAGGLRLALAVVRPSNATRNGTTASYAVAMPDSSTTVALALPSSLSGGAVAVVVTTVEVDASRFSSFGSPGGNDSSNSSATSPTVALPSPQLVSSVVTIQVSQLSSNGSLTATTVPYFETSVSVVRSNSSSGGAGGLSSPTMLAHNCTALTALTVACFALALLYDFQYPEDDGFCAAQMTQAACESRKMLLDPFESQCLWRPPYVSTGSSESSAIADAAAVVQQIVGGQVVETVPITSTADDTQSCRFNGSNVSTLAFIISYVITSAFAGVLGLMLDRCQEVLKAKEATLMLQDRQRTGIADDGADIDAATTGAADRKERSAVREQLAVREYPEATVYRQRCSSIGERSKLSNGRPRRRHAVLDVVMVDEDPMTTRQATGPSTMTMGHDPEVGGHATAAVSVTALAVARALRSMSSTDYAVTMLRLAVADEIALFDYGLCWLVGDEVEAAVRQLEAVASEVAAGPSTVTEDGGLAEEEEDAVSVSQEMARQWPGLPESRWVAGLRAGRSGGDVLGLVETLKS